MEKSDFWYDLPENLIAQTPLEKRDSSKLLVYKKEKNKIEEITFKEIIKFFKKGDLLVLNNSKVLPARIFGKKDTGSKVEFLLLKEVSKKRWETLVKPGKKAKVGHEFIFCEKLKGRIIEVLSNGNRIIEFILDDYKDFYNILDEIGQMPLPHYIKEILENKDRYQTIYAKDKGSSAAPTAGLHFTDELLGEIKAKGVEMAFVTLHVGLGTFRPVKENDITKHLMHSETYMISQETADQINKAKKEKRRVIGVGTTSCRTLEAASTEEGLVIAGTKETNIFITPGYKFKVLDGLITNFHLPESTLIMLVSAFAGYEKTMEIYAAAVKNEYRFYSFGDAMMVI